MPNNDYANEPNQSRSEDIIQSILDNTEYDEEARSRIEYLLIELKNAIEGGGGGGGVTSYSPLTEKPKIDNHTLQAGNNSSSDLGLQTKLTFDSAPTESSTNPVTSGGVHTALATKANADNVYKLALTNADLLPANTDLDNVKTVGCYYVYESVNVTTITNRPTNNTSAFKVTVELAAGKNRPRQIYQEFNSYDRYMRYETSGGTWAAWKKVEGDLSTKQDTISDLSTIRSGAALGATAVQPETGKGLSTNDYTDTEKSKLAGIAEGAEVNVQSNWAQTTTTADDYIKNKPTLGTAAAKNATDTYNATGTDVTTGKAVAAALATLPEPMVFKGSLGTGGTITTLPTASSSNKGYVYKVITAGTYASQSAKIGDTFISDGSAWVLIPSGDEPSGTVTNVAVANGGGLTVSGSPITSSGTITVGHSNSVTAKTSSSLKKFTYDANGHVTGSSELSTAESNALDSGIDSEKVEQIETNKNNILSNQSDDYLLWTSGKNRLKYTLDSLKAINPYGVWTDNQYYRYGITFTVNDDMSITVNETNPSERNGNAFLDLKTSETTGLTGTYVLSGCPSGGSSTEYELNIGTYRDYGSGATVPTGESKNAGGIAVRQTATSVNNLLFKPMLCLKSDYQSSKQYYPYAMSNVELTAAIQAIQAQLASQ